MGRPKRPHKRTSVKGSKFKAGRGQSITASIPSNYRVWLYRGKHITHEKHGLLKIFRYVDDFSNKPMVAIWRGRAEKPYSRYSFKDVGQREMYIDKQKANTDNFVAEKVKRRKATREYVHDVKVGDIFYTSWGYDQTNVEFFQVVGLTGKKTALIREIKQDYTEKGFMSGETKPVKNTFFGATLKKRIMPSGGSGDVYLKIDSCRYAWRYTGGTKYTSSYA